VAETSEFIVRHATPDDAEQLITHVQHMAVEAAQWLPMQPGEFQVSMEEEREILTKAAASQNSLFLVAEVDGKIVGLLNYSGGKRKATRHVATFGMSVRSAWQCRGVGTALLTAAIRHAKESGCIRRLDLQVYADNERAIRLYKRLGFVSEGVLRNTALRNGEFIDGIMMALIW
jgi:RimJ/RimL family protein N-acetyltransferase